MLPIADALFRQIHQRNLVYNACWEDPRLDRRALALSRRDTVLAITSAGCNALDYLLGGAGRVIAVDMNPRQSALLELKRVMACVCPYEVFFQTFGKGRLEGFGELYRKYLRGELSAPSRLFWDRRCHFFDDRGPGLYSRGTTGLFARLMRFYIDRIAGIRAPLQELCNVRSVAEQRALYDEEVSPRFWSSSVRWAIRKHSALALLGVPPAQRAQLERDYQGGVAGFIENAIRSVFRELPFHDNYFWRVYISGEYTQPCCPEYLKEENFHILREQLSTPGNLTIVTSSLLDFLRGYSGKISRFVLLDHMDWLHQHHSEVLAAEWQEMLRCAAPGARFLWRSAGLRTEFVDAIAVNRANTTTRLGNLLRYDRRLAAALHEKDRVHTYGSLHIADLAA